MAAVTGRLPEGLVPSACGSWKDAGLSPYGSATASEQFLPQSILKSTLLPTPLGSAIQGHASRLGLYRRAVKPPGFTLSEGTPSPTPWSGEPWFVCESHPPSQSRAGLPPHPRLGTPTGGQVPPCRRRRPRPRLSPPSLAYHLVSISQLGKARVSLRLFPVFPRGRAFSSPTSPRAKAGTGWAGWVPTSQLPGTFLQARPCQLARTGHGSSPGVRELASAGLS